MHAQGPTRWKRLLSQYLKLFLLEADAAEVLPDQFSGSASGEETVRRDAEKGPCQVVLGKGL